MNGNSVLGVSLRRLDDDVCSSHRRVNHSFYPSTFGTPTSARADLSTLDTIIILV